MVSVPSRNSCSSGLVLAPLDSIISRQQSVAQILRAISGCGVQADRDERRMRTATKRGAASCPRPSTASCVKTSPGARVTIAASDGTLAAALRAGPSAFTPASTEIRSRKADTTGKTAKFEASIGSCGAKDGVGGNAAHVAAPAVGNEQRTARMQAFVRNLDDPDVDSQPGGAEPAITPAELLAQFSSTRTTVASTSTPAFGRILQGRGKVRFMTSGSLPEHADITASPSCSGLVSKRAVTPQRSALRSSVGRQQRNLLGVGGCSTFRQAGCLLAGNATRPKLTGASRSGERTC